MKHSNAKNGSVISAMIGGTDISTSSLPSVKQIWLRAAVSQSKCNSPSEVIRLRLMLGPPGVR
jgi:hypothetical protein